MVERVGGSVLGVGLGGGGCGSGAGMGSTQRAAGRRGGADCAVGSGQWAEPPQYLPALSWVVLRGAREGPRAALLYQKVRRGPQVVPDPAHQLAGGFGAGAILGVRSEPIMFQEVGGLNSERTAMTRADKPRGRPGSSRNSGPRVRALCRQATGRFGEFARAPARHGQ